MASDTQVKICGLSKEADIVAAVEAGANFIGFVFFDKSPRHVSYETAAALGALVPPQIKRVALCVDPDDETVDALMRRVPLDMIQLHGSETPQRVSDIKARTGLPVMKAIGIAEASDLDQIDQYAAVADQLLIDAKPPMDATRPGGNAVSFDWSLMAGKEIGIPWLLAGGLTVDNVADALCVSGADGVDLSSGVESTPGQKDPVKISRFVAAAKACHSSVS